MGNKLKNPDTSLKSYWKIIHRVMNKCRSPKIPPLRVNDKFILDFEEKAKYFKEFSSQQCLLLIIAFYPIELF